MTDNEKKLVNIIKTLCSGVVENSDRGIREEVQWAVGEVKELGFTIVSPFSDDEEE